MLTRLSKRRTGLAVLILATGVPGLGMALWPTRWTSQAASEFPGATTRYREAVSAVADVTTASFVHMGHRAGSFQEFAKNLEAARPETPRAVTELMDRAFGELGLTSIEIDVQPSPLDERELVVVHDRFAGGELGDAARDYAEDNTLRAVLEHYLSQKHYARGKRIALELKSPPGQPDAIARESVDRTVEALRDVLAGHAEAATIRGLIDLLSFNFGVLERLHDQLGPASAHHGLYQIMTSNQGYPDWMFQLNRLPRFDEAAQGRLREVPWLRGVYFDPHFLSDFARLFNGLNEAREARGLTFLELHVSTYSHDLQGLVDRLAAEPEPLRHVHGLVYEIRK